MTISISVSNLQQTTSPTPLSNQVTIISGGPATVYSIQDVPVSGTQGILSLSGYNFVTSSQQVTAAQFANIQIAAASANHEIWINASADGVTWSGGQHFTVFPASNQPNPTPVPIPVPSLTKPPVFRFNQHFDCLAGTIPNIPSTNVNGSSWSPSIPAHWVNSQITFQRQDHDLVGRIGKVHVLGSSGPAGCNVETWSDICINRAVGGQTLAGMLNALNSGYSPSIHEARAVALIGVEINDALDSNVNWTKYQDYLGRLLNWLSGPMVFALIWNTVSQSERAAIAQANAIALGLLANRPNCQIVDINPMICDGNGNPMSGMLLDNEHLDTEGAKILRKAMQEAFGKL